MNGRLIVLEGPDGVGKSTLAEELVKRLRELGEESQLLAFPCKRPGTLGDLVYGIHHNQRNSINASAMQILHIAAHVDAIQQEIKPAIEAGVTVVLDRFYWSTIAYGLASGMDEESLRLLIEVERRAWSGIAPEVLFLVDREEPYRAEWNASEYAVLRSNYQKLAEDSSELTIKVVSNEGPISSVVKQMVYILDQSRNHGLGRETQQLNLFSDVLPERSHGFSERFLKRLLPLKPSPVFPTYWYLAAERQNILFKRLRGDQGPFSSDPILQMHRFTNAYRATDRVSQYLIREVAYNGDQSADELFLRVLLFKIFNKIETWEYLLRAHGPIRVSTFNVDKFDGLLSDAKREGSTIFSGAYIMPSRSGEFRSSRKHRNYLDLLSKMLSDGLPSRLQETKTLGELFQKLRDQPLFGDFLAFQYAIDLNYTNLVNHDESEFVVAGPGAKSGIRKCFIERAGMTDEQIIAKTCSVQTEAFSDLGLDFRDLFGRNLKLIDCQNLFCETDKYARYAHPLVAGIGNRTRIKQVYRQNLSPISLWFPPKWGLNEKIPG